MEATSQIPELPRDDLSLELESKIDNWDKLDYNTKILYRKLYFMHKFEMSTVGKSSLSGIFNPENPN